MARPELRAILVALTLVASGCDMRSGHAAQASVTVKLPSARPYTPSPAFSFKAAQQRAVASSKR